MKRGCCFVRCLDYFYNSPSEDEGECVRKKGCEESESEDECISEVESD